MKTLDKRVGDVQSLSAKVRELAQRAATSPHIPQDRSMPAGRPSAYRVEYAEEVITYCDQGYSLTAFAGSIGVCRDTISEWCEVHPAFSVAVKRAKAKRALWWEDRARQVAMDGGPGGQATMVIFGLKNHAPEDFSDKQQFEHAGKDGKDLIPEQTDPGKLALGVMAILAAAKRAEGREE